MEGEGVPILQLCRQSCMKTPKWEEVSEFLDLVPSLSTAGNAKLSIKILS